MRQLLLVFGSMLLAAACTSGPRGPTHVTSAAKGARPSSSAAALGPADTRLAHELVGQTVPPWTAEEWTNSPPLTLAGLRGRVVLVRWFAGTSCPMCSATAPALRELHRAYASQGLTVLGMYHHKEDAPLKPGEYASYVASYGFEFPVARDPD